MDIKLLSYIPAIVGVFIIGFLVLLNDTKSTKNRLFASLSFLCSLWLGSLFLADTTHGLHLALWSLKLGLFFSGLMMVSFYAFTLYFPHKKTFSASKQALIIFPGVVLAVLSLTPLTVRSVTIRSFGVDPTHIGILYNVSDGVGLLYMLLGVGLLIQKFTRADKLERSQLGFVLSGLLIAIAGNVFSNIIAARYNLDTKFIWVGSFSLFIFSVLVAYSMLHYKLFDIRSFVLRAAAYLFTTVTLSVLYVGPAIYILGAFVLGSSFTWPKFVVSTLIGTIAAINFGRIREWFNVLTGKIFFRDSYDTAQLLGELNRVLVASIDLSKMLSSSADLIAKNIKADYCLFALQATEHTEQRLIGHGDRKISATHMGAVLHSKFFESSPVIRVNDIGPEHAENKKILRKNDIAIVVRLSGNSAGSDSLGYILLGFKKSGNPYTLQDLRVLETIADAMVIAIQNALHFEEIQDFNLTLQQRIYDATAQLRRTNAKLKALDETKDDFISMASHQLRTPLTSVKGYLSMVLEGDAGKITPMQRKMLDQAFVSSQRMVFLIADLLNVSRLKTGKFVIESSPVNLAKTVNDEIDQLKETAKNRELELLYEKPADFPTLMFDETKIRQVIMNFIDNAIYYTPKGGTIRVELQDTPTTVELRVIDNGIGVPKREQPHLFTKFYRAGNARQTRPDGTGLGLFMAKKVVVAQGGAVIFTSEEGKGSTFGFIFPKARLVAPPAPQAVALHVR